MSPFAYLPDYAVATWPNLTPAAAKMLVAIASFFKTNGGGCWPALTTIMSRAGIADDRTARRAVQELADAGLLAVEHRDGQTSIYSWCVPPTTDAGGTSDAPPTNDAETPCKSSTEPLPSDAPRRIVKDKEGKAQSSKPKCLDTTAVRVPDELAGLSLYENDAKLLAAWPDLLDGWRKAYPAIDIPAEIAKSHVWLLANPKKKRPNRAAFISNWLTKAEPSPEIAAAAQADAEWARQAEAYQSQAEATEASPAVREYEAARKGGAA